MSNKPSESILITLEIFEGKTSEFIDCLFKIDTLREKGKPVSAKLLNTFFDSFTTHKKSENARVNKQVNKLVKELLSRFGKPKYNFQIKQFESLGFREILPNGKMGKAAMKLTEYSLTDLITKIYLELLGEKNKDKFEKIGDFIKHVKSYFIDYLSGIKSEKEILSKWKIGLLTTSIAVQFGHLPDAKNYKELGSGITYEAYLYDKFRYYTERKKKSKE